MGDARRTWMCRARATDGCDPRYVCENVCYDFCVVIFERACAGILVDTRVLVVTTGRRAKEPDAVSYRERERERERERDKELTNECFPITDLRKLTVRSRR